MKADEILEALSDGKTLINNQNVELYINENDKAFVILGGGFCSRAASYETHEDYIIHFGNNEQMMDIQIFKNKFTIITDDWKVKE